MKLLPYCVALAAGEALGLIFKGSHPAWPLIFGLLIFTVLLGYGKKLAGWTFFATFLIGLLIAFSSSGAQEALYREKPWMLQRREIRQPPRSAFPSLQENLAKRVDLGLEHDPDASKLNRAILLGQRGNLTKTAKQIFIDSGTIHIFAISGLHIMAAAMLFLLLPLAFGISFRWASLMAIPLLWFYTLLIGHPPSAVRAALMATFYFSAPLCFRRPDAMTAWALAFLLVHGLRPELLFDVGSALSFTIMLTLLLWIQELSSLPSRFTQLFCLTLVTWAASVPIAAHVFARITPGGLLANLVLIPAATACVWTGLVGILLSGICPFAAAHFNNLSALFTNAMTGVATLVAGLPGANLAVPPWPLWECFAWYAALLLALIHVRLVKARRRRL